MVRKIIAIIVLMLVSLIGCTFGTTISAETSENPEQKAAAPAPVVKVETEKVLIGYAYIDFKYSDGHWQNVQNAKRALEILNGTIIQPNEEFSYNLIVGERTYAKRFIDGLNSQNQWVPGGGVCRGSTNVFDAVLDAIAKGYNLKVTERHPHSPACGYVPKGMDAMVQWGSCDFRFLNSTEYPIKVGTSTTYLEKATRTQVWIVQLKPKTVIEYQ